MLKDKICDLKGLCSKSYYPPKIRLSGLRVTQFSDFLPPASKKARLTLDAVKLSLPPRIIVHGFDRNFCFQLVSSPAGKMTFL